ncbi:LIC_10190 family membrane protein [Cloacibacterium sp.]|uniref:LIC_10190 family membrane protein n=1 Tax=Cloacibacterium sp. TaxID=1913682 RepID=UPI0039E2EEFA
MLYILLSIIIILPVLAGFGEIFQKIFGEMRSTFSAKIFSGIFSLAMLWQILVFFIPLNIWVESVSLIIGFLAFFYFKIYRSLKNFSKNEVFKLSLLLIIVIFSGSYYPFILDHFGYYVPSINWLSEFGLTKGLANLNLIYAQMSVWHVFQAGFSNVSDVFLRINVVFLIAFFIYIFEKKMWILLFISPVFLLFLQSPSPDLPAIVLSLIILNEIIKGNRNFKLLFAFSVFVFTIKPTMIWLPMFVFLYFFKRENLKFLWLGILVGLIYIFKNIWLFGYPFFPVQIGNFGVSWLPNSEILKYSSEVAIAKTYDLQYSISEIQKFTFWDYIFNWFTLHSYKKYIHILFVLSLIFFGFFTFKKRDKLTTILFASILLKSFLVLVFSAQYRFFIDVFFVVFLIVFNDRVKEKLALFNFSFGAVIILFLMSFPQILQSKVSSFKLGYYMQGFVKTQFYKPAYFELNSYKTFKIGNLDFNVPNYDLCFDTPQPALSPDAVKKYFEAGIFPQKITENLKDGFTWKKLSKDEKEKLKIIISSLEKKR